MTVQFYFTVNEDCPDDWCNVLHVGDSDAVRTPGIFIHGGYSSFVPTMSDNDHWNNKVYLDAFNVTADGEEHLFYFRYTANERVYAIDGTELYREECPGTTDCSFDNSDYHGVHTVYLSDPWYTVMNMSIRDLQIYQSMLEILMFIRLIRSSVSILRF